MTIKFKEVTKHGRLEFIPNVPYAFDDEDAEPYFIAAGWAEKATDEPYKTFTKGEVDIDPNTVFGSGPKMGQRVLDEAPKPTTRAASRSASRKG